ncbi:hypothetical protein, partial [Pseudomonas mandelii]|uniref:hypothetical protein n=1 Tax=Pseudomonas mandelii TaxID=75612 RepID=UPI00224B85C5
TVSKIYESELPDVTSNSESIATMGKEFKVVMYATHTISDGTSTNKEQKVCMSFGGECILISH